MVENSFRLLSFLLLAATVHLNVQATNFHNDPIRTPSHLLAKRNPKFPRALLEGQLTVGSLFNASITIVGTSLNDTNTTPNTIPSASSPTKSTSLPAPRKPKGCFPFHSNSFMNGTVPTNMTTSDWWCKDEEMYGFLGFSYPLEVADCSDPSNQYEKIRIDLERMKTEFGATFVRPYGVECRQVSIWENLVKACIDLGMALIVQVWWGFQDDQNLWRKGQQSIYQLFENSTYSRVAPFVIYSASFGSEPIGDWVDGDDFVSDLTIFRKKMNSFGVKVGISEDWDRPQRMKEGAVVAGIGEAILNATDVAQLHVMPYYHPDEVPTIDGAWDYVEKQAVWAHETLKQPTMITETMWSSQRGGSHGRGSHDEESTLDNYRQYWESFSSNCDFFKEQQVGYFVHTYDDSMEPFFGMIGSNGETKIEGWKPNRC